MNSQKFLIVDMELIDKEKVVAEIDRRKRKLLDHIICERDKEWAVRTAHQLNKIIMFINTIEVKDVDLEKESMNYLLNEHKSPLTKIMHGVDLGTEMQYHKDIQNAYKAGFKDGLKAKEGK